MSKKIIMCGLALLALVLLNIHLATAMQGPETATLSSLTNLFEPVSFNHAMHVDVASNDCAVCHHHTTGTPVTDERCARCHKNSGPANSVACRDCHSDSPFSAESLQKISDSPLLYHTGKPGLKGAYHRKCLGCHKEMGAPTECEACHKRTDKGDAFYRSGKYAPTPGNDHAEE
jgi:hypothetical protein